MGIVVAFDLPFLSFFCNFLVKFLTLGTRKWFKLIKYPILGIMRSQFRANFVVKIAREGTKKLSKCHSYACTPG